MKLIDADELMKRVLNIITESSGALDWINLINSMPEETVAQTKWIPVEERLPEEDKWVQVVVKRHRWISDFGDKSVPDEEKEDHPEQNYVTLGKIKKDNTWVYLDLESDDECLWTSIANDCSQEDLSYPMTEVLAWMPLPEPYRANMEEKPDASADWKGHYMDRFEKVE